MYTTINIPPPIITPTVPKLVQMYDSGGNIIIDNIMYDNFLLKSSNYANSLKIEYLKDYIEEYNKQLRKNN